MDYIKKLEMKYSNGYSYTIHANYEFREKIEAKYKIVEMIKKVASKILKAALPALVLFSSTGYAKIKDPNELGKKFQAISQQIAGKSVVQTHVLQNDPDQPQIIVYTIKIDRGSTDSPSSATIKYIEGKGASFNSPSWQRHDDEANLLAGEFKTILTALDTQAKKQVQQDKQLVQK